MPKIHDALRKIKEIAQDKTVHALVDEIVTALGEFDEVFPPRQDTNLQVKPANPAADEFAMLTGLQAGDPELNDARAWLHTLPPRWSSGMENEEAVCAWLLWQELGMIPTGAYNAWRKAITQLVEASRYNRAVLKRGVASARKSASEGMTIAHPRSVMSFVLAKAAQHELTARDGGKVIIHL